MKRGAAADMAPNVKPGMHTFYLREIAHARAGDKGDASNIGVIAYRPEDYPLLVEQVTVKRVRAHFGDLVRGAITRYELPNVDALNFVLENSLGGGVTRSLSLDPHGKSYGALILTLPVTVSDAVAARLVAQGRKPLASPAQATAAPPRQRVNLTLADARALSMNALTSIGYNAANATILTDHLLDAALCGYEYSGLPKILQIANSPKQKQPVTPMRVLHETPVSTLFDGGNRQGMLTMHHATGVAIAKARAHGFALVGVNNSWMSGRSAYYAERIARADLIALHTVGAASLVAPPGGTRPAFGTNPIAFGFPTEGEPLVIDVGTSAFPGTELGFYALLGLPLPDGMALDSAGAPTTDAEAVFEPMSSKVLGGRASQAEATQRFPSINTKQIRAVLSERLAQAWLVPRWISTSPARMSVSLSSITAQISPSRMMA